MTLCAGAYGFRGAFRADSANHAFPMLKNDLLAVCQGIRQLLVGGVQHFGNGWARNLHLQGGFLLGEMLQIMKPENLKFIVG